METVLWVTPKIFDDLADPGSGAAAFFDHYAETILDHALTVVFATGNGDHILNYRGESGIGDRFDWARYNCFAQSDAGPDTVARSHNREWLTRVREGGERSFNPYSAGPMVIMSEQTLDYTRLAALYESFRAESRKRGLVLTLLEYLEPGPEFCRSEWKQNRHPEVSAGEANAGGHIVPGVIDVTLPLQADDHHYAAYPAGFPEGTIAGDFVAKQTGEFIRAFALDGVLLGNQFGLTGFWDPKNAPPLTPERSAGIARFFAAMRTELGDSKLYWMDTYWSVDVEREAWGMTDACYLAMDAILVSTFAVLVERTEIERNVLSKIGLGGPRVLFGLDFVDPWYWYRTYLDDRRTYLFQREVLERYRDRIDGVSFFANDTFGHFVERGPLDETSAVWSPR